jgi:hypothetical protein
MAYKNLICAGWSDNTAKICDADTGVCVSTCCIGNQPAYGRIVNGVVNGETATIICEKKTLIFNARTGGLLRTM